MTKEEIKELQDRTYAIGWSGFPIDTLFNDIRDNNNPRFNKDLAYKDFKKIIDEIYILKDKAKKYDDKATPKKLKSKTDKDGRLLLVCPNCGDVYMKFWSDVETVSCRKHCDECGQALDFGDEDGNGN